MAKFLQATMEELSLERHKMKEGESKVKDFSEFLKKVSFLKYLNQNSANAFFVDTGRTRRICIEFGAAEIFEIIRGRADFG